MSLDYVAYCNATEILVVCADGCGLDGRTGLVTVLRGEGLDLGSRGWVARLVWRGRVVAGLVGELGPESMERLLIVSLSLDLGMRGNALSDFFQFFHELFWRFSIISIDGLVVGLRSRSWDIVIWDFLLGLLEGGLFFRLRLGLKMWRFFWFAWVWTERVRGWVSSEFCWLDRLRLFDYKGLELGSRGYLDLLKLGWFLNLLLILKNLTLRDLLS